MGLFLDFKEVTSLQNQDLSSIEKSFLCAIYNLDLEKIKQILSTEKIDLTFNNFEGITLLYKIVKEQEIYSLNKRLKEKNKDKILNEESLKIFEEIKQILLTSDDNKLMDFIFRLSKNRTTKEFEHLNAFLKDSNLKIREKTISTLFCCFSGIPNSQYRNIILKYHFKDLNQKEKEKVSSEKNILELLAKGSLTDTLKRELDKDVADYENISIAFDILDRGKSEIKYKKDFLDFLIKNGKIEIKQARLSKIISDNDFEDLIDILDLKDQLKIDFINELIANNSKKSFNEMIKKMKKEDYPNKEKDIAYIFKNNIFERDSYYLTQIINNFKLVLNEKDWETHYRILIFTINNIELLEELEDKGYQIKPNSLSGFVDPRGEEEEISSEMAKYLLKNKGLEKYMMENKEKISKSLCFYVNQKIIGDF